MATALAQILGGSLDLIPHIEALAIKWIARNYVMSSRVVTFNDMIGFNPRKVSEYGNPLPASEVNEATDIPVSDVVRARLSTLTIKEIGKRYDLTDRRVTTDIENILKDIVSMLGQGVGDKLENDLFQQALLSFTGGNIDNSASVYDIGMAVNGQYEFAKLTGSSPQYGVLRHVIHPFQAREVMKLLINYSGASAGANLQFRNDAIRSWTVPGFDNLEIVQSAMLPRNITWRVRINATGGTFRLTVADLVTAAITVSTTGATMDTNLTNALNALGLGTWNVVVNSLDDIDVTPPATLYVSASQELRVPVDPANPTAEGYVSAYDLTTGRSAGVLGLDRAGVDFGVIIEEEAAVAKSLLFYPEALGLDIRQMPKANANPYVNQGRTVQYALHMKYGLGAWKPSLGMTVATKATSSFAKP